MIKSLPIVAAAILSTALTATSAFSDVIIADYNSDGVWTGYNTDTSTYGVKFRDDGDKDGFWLVVSDGGNPKTHENELAILYGDRAANRITAYAYDGQNNANSYQNGTLLGTYDNVFAEAGQHPTLGYDLTMFTLDVSEINNAFTNEGWDGIQIGEQAGIWFHQSAGSDFQYDDFGSIVNYSYTDQMYLDQAFDTTYTLDCTARPDAPACGAVTSISQPGGGGGGSVPAPGGLALILVGLAAFGRKFRNTKA